MQRKREEIEGAVREVLKEMEVEDESKYK